MQASSLCFGGRCEARGAQQMLDVSRIDAKSDRSGTVKIRTDEGDTVTISFQAKEALSLSNGKSSVGKSMASETSSSSKSSMRFAIDVNGDLSHKEMADVGKLLRTLAASVSGNGERQMPRLNESLGSLESYQFDYRSTSEAAFSRMSLAA